MRLESRWSESRDDHVGGVLTDQLTLDLDEQACRHDRRDCELGGVGGAYAIGSDRMKVVCLFQRYDQWVLLCLIHPSSNIVS